MKLITEMSKQKLRGGYYTPKKMTDFIMHWGLLDGYKNRVLEPSCGDGAFLESLMEYRNGFEECLAIELDEEEALKASNRVKDISNIQIINNDFFDEYELNLRNQEFDLIIGNPPYIRYQFLSPSQREMHAAILSNNGMKPNKLINAWVSFLVASVERLSEEGKIAMVIPAEILQVAYAADLRLYLTNHLSKVTVITFKKLVFPDVQQEVVLLMGEKSLIKAETKISVVELNDLEDLDFDILNRKLEYKEIDHNKDKWTKYFLSKNELTAIKEIANNKCFKKISEYAQVDIGITTGNNKYFSVTKETIQKFNLEKITLPLIGRSAHAKGLYFTEKDWMENVEDGYPASLLLFPDVPFEELPSNLQSYVKQGEENGENTGYKCKIRKNWYRIPSVWEPDAFFLRRNDKYPKFVLNSTNAVSTDTMHRIRFNDDIDKNKVILGYYNSISLAFTEIEGRSYGGGVLEVLPGEVESILIPDLSGLDSSTTQRLMHLVDCNIREKGDIEDILPEINQEILINYLGINPEVVQTFNNIWKKLMNRRRDRK